MVYLQFWMLIQLRYCKYKNLHNLLIIKKMSFLFIKQLPHKKGWENNSHHTIQFYSAIVDPVAKIWRMPLTQLVQTRMNWFKHPSGNDRRMSLWKIRIFWTSWVCSNNIIIGDQKVLSLKILGFYNMLFAMNLNVSSLISIRTICFCSNQLSFPFHGFFPPWNLLRYLCLQTVSTQNTFLMVKFGFRHPKKFLSALVTKVITRRGRYFINDEMDFATKYKKCCSVNLVSFNCQIISRSL